MRRLDLAIRGAFGLVLGACASHSAAGSSCPAAGGTYELTVTGTGQSANHGDAGICPGPDTTQVVDVTIEQGNVSIAGETCTLCSSSGCIIDIVCGDTVTCPGTSTPPASPADTYVQALTFVVPGAAGSDASTINAVVSLGANDCVFEGTAARTFP